MTDDKDRDLRRRVAMIEAKMEIERAMKRYAHTADRRDMANFLDVYKNGATHNCSGYYDGPIPGFAKFGFDAHKDAKFTAHYITNIEVDVDLDKGTALTECYFLAAHHVLVDAPKEAFGNHIPGTDEIWWVGGKYFDRFECIDGKWKIVHRTAVHDWEQWIKVDARGFMRNARDVPVQGPYSEDQR